MMMTGLHSDMLVDYVPLSVGKADLQVGVEALGRQEKKKKKNWVKSDLAQHASRKMQASPEYDMPISPCSCHEDTAVDTDLRIMQEHLSICSTQSLAERLLCHHQTLIGKHQHRAKFQLGHTIR
jgi:hypothetical protein